LRAAGLTRQLLVFAGKGAVAKERVSAAVIGTEAARQLRAATPNHIDIQTDLEETLPSVIMDPVQMHQIFTSLILNAVEAIGAGKRGHVKVSASLNNGFIRIAVSDNGSGMDETVKSRMFEPFYTTKFVGRGLGLAAVDGIVRNLGGRIAVDSKIGRGTCVEIDLPAESPMLVKVQPASEAAFQPANGAGAVLIVDDEASIRALAAALLEKVGITYFEASSGLEAIDRVRMHGRSIRAMLLDVTMPGLRGDEILQAIHELHPHIQVIVTSGYSEFELSRQFEGLKVRAFLTKPYTRKQLLEHVLPAVQFGMAA
jgi:CheY-like chemotaxis protein